MDWSTNLQMVAAGLAMGSIYALVALGFVLIFNAVNVVNFAQGEFAMVPAFIAVWLLTSLNIPFVLTCVITVVFMGIFGIVFERIAYYPLRNRSFLPVVISTIGGHLPKNGAQMILVRNRCRCRANLRERGEHA
jgi:branched-chain amino acid transport system permease protein